MKWEEHHAIKRALVQPMLDAGMSSGDLAEKLGMTRQGVSHMLKMLGCKRPSVVAAERRAERAAMLAAKSDDASHARFGCDVATRKMLIAIGASAAFIRQKNNARHRAIGWGLTLGQWWRIWEESGHWDDRGRTKGCYVMGRRGDLGDYVEGNVEIVSHSENAITAQSHAEPGKGGVYKTMPGLAKPWTAYKNRRCLGYFSTREEALAFRDCA